MISTILSIALAVFKAVPILKEVWDQLIALYISREIAAMKQENKDAIRKAMDEHDQRDIEKALGSKRAGEHSGSTDTVVVDSLPNVGMHN
jgi:hypothetical protein